MPPRPVLLVGYDNAQILDVAVDGHVYTSAGVTSALDLTFALIEDDHGPTLARAVARGLLTDSQT